MFDPMHGDPDFRQKQHAMVRAAADPRRNPRFPGTPAAPPIALRLRPRELPDQSRGEQWPVSDRKSTRLNSSHANISYAVFCLKYYVHRQYLHFSLHDALPIWMFDPMHGDPDFRQKQHAMVRAAADPRRNPRFPGTPAAPPIALRLRPRELPDQSRGEQWPV